VSTNDLINVGLSAAADDKLAQLKEMGVFADKIDGYRFGVSLAIAQGVVPGDLVKRVNLYNVGSVDPDQSLRRSVEALMPTQVADTTVYRLIERLADWGVTELYAQAKAGEIDFVALLDQAGAKAA
jgi:hypothetical protein